MPRESANAKAGRATGILQRLKEVYPEARCELYHANPLELLVATILSAQCADAQVNRVTAGLFQRYRSAADYAAAPREALEQELQRLGLFRNKARSIQECCRQLIARHNGEVPDTMEALTALAGVGRKTANVVLGNAFRRNVGVVVDTHVSRLSNRLGLSQAEHPEAIERDLMKLVPQAEWTDFSHLLIWHGRRRCRARNPDCAGCEIREACPSPERSKAP